MRLLIAAFGFLMAWSASPASHHNLPPLAAGFVDDRGAFDAPGFDARLKRDYPVGSAQNDLLVDLRRQGFFIKKGCVFGDYCSRGLQAFDHGALVFTLAWDVDADGNITDIHLAQASAWTE